MAGHCIGHYGQLLELARVAYGDPRKLFYDDGTPIPIHKLGPDEAAMISMELEVERRGR